MQAAAKAGTYRLLLAAERGDIQGIKRVLSDGTASITAADSLGTTALLHAALSYHADLGTAQWLLSDGGSNIGERNYHGATVWSNLENRIPWADDWELSSLLRVMVLLGDAPPSFVRLLKPQHALIIERGKQILVILPAYLNRQCAEISAYCSLPSVLHPLIAAYAAPTNEDKWADSFRLL
jgi:hypothetical protein